MDKESPDCFKVRRAPNAKFYLTRQEQAICTRTGSLCYFDTERDVLEFLAEIEDTMLN
jgi:hypothetical protein